MTRRETYIEKKVTEHALSRGYVQRKVAYVGRRGAPDRWYFGHTGRLVIIEFKDTNGSLSYHQKKEIGILRDRGFEVHVIDNIPDGIALFDRLEQEHGG